MKKKPNVSNHVIVSIPLSKKQDNAVAGLIWQPLHSVRALQAEAKNLIKNEKCEHFVIHAKGNRAQCGMTATLSDKKRHYSAALMLIEKLGDSWLGIFQLPDGRYWLVGADSGQIVPGCDAIFTELEDVLARYKDYKELFPWEAIYVSPEISIEGKSLNLKEVLTSVSLNSQMRINYVFEFNKRTRKIVTKAIILIMFCGALLAVWNYYQHKLEVERQARIAAALAAQKQQDGFSEQEWRRHIPAQLVISRCFQEIGNFQINLSGWSASAISCDGKTVKAIYKPGQNATTKNFIQQVQKLYPNQYNFQKGSLGEIQLPLTISGDRKQENLQPVAQIAENILEKLQLGLATGKIDDVLVSKQKTANFELSSQITPVNLMQNINLDGVVINNLVVTLSEQMVLTWKVSGVIYGK